MKPRLPWPRMILVAFLLSLAVLVAKDLIETVFAWIAFTMGAE